MGLQDMSMGASLFASQWRMSRMQVYNWGTFCGYHDFPMLGEGLDGKPAVIMITGESGTGKSTLLDAKTAVLMPYNVRFNAASNRTTKGRARSETERNVYSYLLGQQDNEVDEATGERRERFLRDRSRANWSAIVLTFAAAEGGGEFAAARFYYVPANSQRNDYRTLYVTAEHDLDPRLMERVASEPFTPSVIRQVYADATVFDGVRNFLHDTYHTLQIGSGESGRNAMRLHEQIQAGYSVEDVDGLFKSLVLDEPTTYEIARQACDSFDDREQTWVRMQEVQEKTRDLASIRNLHDEWERRCEEVALLTSLGAECEDGSLSLWICRREARVCTWSSEEETERVAHLDAQLEREHILLQKEDAELRQTDRLVLESGGAEIDRLREDISRAREELRKRRRQRDTAVGKLEGTGYELPMTDDEYVQLSLHLAEARDGEEAAREVLKRREIEHGIHVEELRRQYDDLKGELEHYRGQRGLMPKAFTELRDRLAQILHLSPDELPFAAELMDLRRTDEEWRVAANVGFHGLARTLLVDQSRLRDLSVHINSMSVRFRLHFEGVDVGRAYHLPDADNSMLSAKLVFLEDSPFVGWLRSRASDQSVDYECVDDPHDLDGSEAQITREGQTRKGRRGAHGYARDSLVIGFENSQLIRELEGDIAEIVAKLGQANVVDQEIRDEERRLRVVHDAATWILEHSFEDMDVCGKQAQIDDMVERLRQLQSSDDLRHLIEMRDELRRAVTERNQRIGALDNERREHDERYRDLSRRIGSLRERSARIEDLGVALDEKQLAKLEDLADEFEQNYLGDSWELLAQNYDRVRGGIETQIRREQTVAQRLETQHRNALEQVFDRYRDKWLGEESDIGVSVESYPDYLEILGQLEEDELTHEVADVWLGDLFRQTAGSLVRLLNAYREDLQGTRGRIEQINDIMGGFKFGPEGGHLTIDQRETHPADVENLRSELRGWTAYATAERGRKYRSSEHDELRSFMARLREDLSGNVHPLLNTQRLINMSITVTWPPETERSRTVFTTLSAKSGGETQELVAFILGAALLYCLGNNYAGKPSFSPVFLDEAFIKADDRYTRRAVRALTGLGFQVIIAVPTNKVQEVEPVADQYVCVTKRRSDGHSFVLPMTTGEGTDDAQIV